MLTFEKIAFRIPGKIFMSTSKGKGKLARSATSERVLTRINEAAKSKPPITKVGNSVKTLLYHGFIVFTFVTFLVTGSISCRPLNPGLISYASV